MILPGLMDSHIHVALTGESAHYVDLSDCTSIDAMKTALAVHAKKHPGLPWIIGVNWDQVSIVLL
jgi:predicted amidohydrolase YtcJ